MLLSLVTNVGWQLTMNQLQPSLLDALHVGDDAKFFSVLEQLLQYPEYNPNDPIYPRSGDTLVHVMARLGRLSALRRLKQAFDPLNLNPTNIQDAKRPLHEAAQFGRHRMVQALFEMDNGLDVDCLKRADWSPLMLAATKPGPDALATVNILLEKGASPHLKNKDGWNAFHLAVREGDVEIVSAMLSLHPDCCRTVSNNGRTPQHTAALHARLGVLRILPDVYTARQDSCGTSPLMDAIKSGNQEVVDLLAQSHPADLPLKDQMDRNALDVAAHCGVDVQNLVCKWKFNPNQTSDRSGMRPVHWAALEGHLAVVRSLVDDLGADIDVYDAQGRSPLSLAVAGNRLDVAKYLLDKNPTFDVHLLSLVDENQTEMRLLIKETFEKWKMHLYFPNGNENDHNANNA